MADAPKKELATRLAYKSILSTVDSQPIMHDLIARYIIRDPIVRGDHDATMVNIGMQRLAMQVCQKVYGGGKALRAAIESAYQQLDQGDE